MATLSHHNFPPPFIFSDPNPHTLPAGAPKFLRRPAAPHLRLPGAALCSCSNHSDSPSSPSGWWWDSTIREGFKNLVRRLDSYWNQETDEASSERRSEGEEGEDWDWDRWKKHFAEVDEQERLVSILKAQLGHAVLREDYVDAARLKVAIAAGTTDDFVGRVLSHLNRSIEEEHYWDAAFIRDYAGAGLVGWWVGTSEDSNDPFGRIIRISAEYGRYVAKSYSPRQLATGTAGVPLFEIFITIDGKGEYKQQAVYLKGSGVSQDSLTVSSGATNSFKSPDSSANGSDLLTAPTEDGEDRDDDSDIISGPTGFQNILHGMIPGVKVKVLKVIGPGKVDRDIISKIFEQIMEDEDEEKDTEQENMGTEDKIRDESDQEEDESEVIASDESIDGEEKSDLAVKVIISGLVHKLSGRLPAKDLQRLPAKLTKNGRFSFSLSIENDNKKQDSGGEGQDSLDRKAKRHDQSNIKFDLTNFIGREKIPLKVLKDLSELINLTLSQVQNHQPLSKTTMFNRIETPTSSDPLNGLYIGAHGIFMSEVIHLRRKFGQWQEYDQNKEPSDLELYEYVEALKLTGDPHVPAGEVAFRAKVGKRNQLPHKGIIPEEFGVIARYRGQGRLAEPGFRNPRWVDGELVILDGKYIRGGPVVGFVYWAPEYHFLVFFNRLRLQE